MKTIIMKDPIMESEGSLFPKVCVNFDEASSMARSIGARLPTSEEYDRLFAIRPWPHLIWEWTYSEQNGERVVRGGSWRDGPGGLRSAHRLRSRPGNWDQDLGFRCAKDIGDDEPVPKGWIQI